MTPYEFNRMIEDAEMRVYQHCLKMTKDRGVAFVDWALKSAKEYSRLISSQYERDPLTGYYFIKDLADTN